MTYLNFHFPISLRWRHNDRAGVSNHQPHACLLNRVFRRRSKKISKLRVTGLCAGNSPGPVNSPHKGPVTRKMFSFDDVIMILRPILSKVVIINVRYLAMCVNTWECAIWDKCYAEGIDKGPYHTHRLQHKEYDLHTTYWRRHVCHVKTLPCHVHGLCSLTASDSCPYHVTVG